MQDMRLAGEALVETVLAQVEERATPSPILPTRLVVRASTGG
jgi:DNA-binding LacI/PurR family transcriptional regulator